MIRLVVDNVVSYDTIEKKKPYVVSAYDGAGDTHVFVTVNFDRAEARRIWSDQNFVSTQTNWD